MSRIAAITAGSVAAAVLAGGVAFGTLTGMIGGGSTAPTPTAPTPLAAAETAPAPAPTTHPSTTADRRASRATDREERDDREVGDRDHEGGEIDDD